jgi:cytochrome P450
LTTVRAAEHDHQMAEGIAVNGTPGPSPRLVAWRLLTRRNLMDVFEEFAPYGDVVRWTLGRRPFYAVRRPEHVEHVLVANQDNYGKSADYELLSIALGKGLLTNDGDSWAGHRRLLQPLFAKRRVMRFAASMTETIEGFAESLERRPDGEPIDIAAAMNELALEVVAKVLFGTAMGGQAERLRSAVLVGLRGEVVGSRLQLLVAMPRPLVQLSVRAMFTLPLPLAGLRRLRDALLTIDDVVGGIVAERRSRPESLRDPDDLLGLLLTARDEGGRTMSDEQVRDELLTFMIAGSETLATGLTWMWHLLAASPPARERLYAEVDEVVGGGTPTGEDADRLPWTTAAFYEALRLRPPVWLFDRRALGEDEIGGHRIPAGSTLLVPAFLVHRDPAVWSEPDRFLPERFLPENSRGRPRGSYLPFGAGRRVCIGAGFATVEAALITAMIAQRFRFDNISGRPAEPETTVILRPRDGLPMTLRRR